MKKVVIILAVLVGLIMTGPVVHFNKVDTTPIMLDSTTIENIQEIVEFRDRNQPVRPGNESIIYWANKTKEKTPYVLLYIHGFTASPAEGLPTSTTIAEKYGMNFYAPRLKDHGLESINPLKEFTPKRIINSTNRAIQEAKTMGDSIIIMATSTGATLSLILAPEEPKIAGHILYSPNLGLSDKRSSVLNKPWGKTMLHLLTGDKIIHDNYDEEQSKYWYKEYSSESILALQHLLTTYMTKAQFQKINEPLFVGAYYKNKEQQDKIISVPAIRNFFHEVSTAPNHKQINYYPNAGDHVIPSSLKANQIADLIEDTGKFIEKEFKLTPIK